MLDTTVPFAPARNAELIDEFLRGVDPSWRGSVEEPLPELSRDASLPTLSKALPTASRPSSE